MAILFMVFNWIEFQITFPGGSIMVNNKNIFIG